MTIRVAAFTKYDRLAASTRQRVLQYVPELSRAGIELSHYPLLDDDYVRSLATGERYPWPKIVSAYVARLRQILEERRCDALWIYAELFPKLPGWFERLAFRSGSPVVYDFDDAFFTPYEEHPSAVVRGLLAGKLESLIAGSAAVCCGNDYLLNYASRFNSNCMVLPTVVDTSAYVPGSREPSFPLTIGWIGSPSTWPNVRPLLPLLAELCRREGARFRVTGAGSAADDDKFEGMELVEWSEGSEISDVQQMGVGIMPLLDLPFQRGKSGYKLVQYMACGVPVVASPVGVNRSIVEPGVNGFLASTQEEWRTALAELIHDTSLRVAMGKAGREKAVRQYSLESQAPRLVSLFRSLTERQ